MRPIRLYLKNFRNHKETNLLFDGFNNFLILGKNKNNPDVSNGVGKTTIYNGIEYIIYNQVYNGTLDQIIRDGQKKVIGEFEFELSSGIYKIYRHRTSASADLRLYKKNGDEWEPLSKRTPSETEEELKKIVKISHKAFVFSVLFRQADLAGISNEKDSKSRIKILKEPLNLSKYTKLEKISTNKIKPLKIKIEEKNTAIVTLGDPEADIVEAKKNLIACKQSIADNKSKLDDILNVISKKEAALEDLKASLSTEDSDVHDKISRKEKEIDTLKASLIKENKNLDKEKEHIKEINEKLSRLKSKLKENQDKLNTLEEKSSPVIEIKASLDKVCADETKGIELISQIKAELNHIKTAIPDEAVCPACDQPITDDYRHNFEEEVSKKVIAKTKDLEFYQEALRKCRLKKTKLEKQISEIENIYHEIDRSKQSIEHCENNIKNNSDHLKKSEERINELEQNISFLNNSLQEALSHLTSLKESAQKSNIAELNNKIFAASDEIKLCKQNSESIRTESANLSSKQGALEERIKLKEDDKKKIIDLKDELKILNKQFKAYSKAIFAFSYKGIPTYKIRNILSELQFETNKVLKDLRPELEVKLDGELNIEFRRDGNVREYGQLSYGQKVYIALAFKMGLSRVIQHRLGIDLRLLNFDEVDANLDDAGLEAFRNAINKWKEKYTIFVITHNRELKESFSKAILVEEDEEGSEASIVDSW